MMETVGGGGAEGEGEGEAQGEAEDEDEDGDGDAPLPVPSPGSAGRGLGRGPGATIGTRAFESSSATASPHARASRRYTQSRAPPHDNRILAAVYSDPRRAAGNGVASIKISGARSPAIPSSCSSPRSASAARAAPADVGGSTRTTSA